MTQREGIPEDAGCEKGFTHQHDGGGCEKGFRQQQCPRPASALSRLLVYSFASLMDVILSSVFFVAMVRFADGGQSPVAVAALMPIWAIIYTLSSLAAGHVVTQRNAGWILIGSCLANLTLSVSFIALPGFWAMYVLMAFQGCATAFFFTPFQYFMKLVDAGHQKSVAHSCGLYVFSWSTGFALGPFIAGFLWSRGWQVCHVFNAAAALVIMVGVFALKHQAETARPAAEAQAANGGRNASGSAALPDLAWMAWVFGGLGCVIISMIRSVFPSTGEAFDISKPEQGTVLFALSAVQAVLGLWLARRERWMFRAWPVLAFGVFGIVGLALFAVAHGAGLFYLAAISFSLYSGFFYFYFVFHSLIHPTRAARYVSINEAVVGVAAVVGPLAGGYLAKGVHLSTPYLASAGILVIAMPAQAWLHARLRSAAAVAIGV